MAVRIIDYDCPFDDSKQIFNEGDMVIEIKDEEITNISIYGEPQNNKKDLKIPDKIYEHTLFVYAFKGNKLLCKKLLGQYDDIREEYYDGKYGLLEIIDDVYEDDDKYNENYDDECDDEYDDECNDDNYAEEVRRYELNRSYRNYDEYCDYASNDSEDFDYQYSEDNGYDPY